ncbi:MAG: ribonuclease PH, partial [Candidatus Syntrophonatronum acetioxidans]
MRKNGREFNEIRKINIIRPYTKFPEGSVLFEMGDTRVICSATVEEKVPHFMKGEKKGWITAEYSMLPRATEVRKVREATKGRMEGRT